MVAAFHFDVHALHSELLHLRHGVPGPGWQDGPVGVALEHEDGRVLEPLELLELCGWARRRHREGCPDIRILGRQVIGAANTHIMYRNIDVSLHALSAPA